MVSSTLLDQKSMRVAFEDKEGKRREEKRKRERERERERERRDFEVTK